MPILRMSAIASVILLAACTATTADVKPQSKTLADAQNPACLSESGSRVPSTNGCPAFGHSYSNQDLERTGSSTVGGALRLLDPTMTVHQ